ncbi:CDP-alcohol phosphatidyltransferase family protein [Aestuariivirga sp.]|uniref:CDP-alcohol phosphatidyltransferase family protein n=1 Tax=Aestuariivirga sp. TaxID=2650926 RepID=UPI0039E402AC
MFDRQMLALSKPVVDFLARKLAEAGVTAIQVSLTGFGFGVLAALLIAADEIGWAILPLLINRLCDGLDGAVARRGTPTDLGAFLDITLDFFFYAGVPLAFAWCDPTRNALAAATLLAAFIGTGVTFLAYAIMAEKRGEKSTAYPSKAFYYLGGLTEGFETVVCFVVMCLWPEHFPLIAYLYAALCCVTILTRMTAGWERFGSGR